MSYLIVDVETVLNEALPYSGTSRDGALPAAPHHRIVVLGMLLLDSRRGNHAPIWWRADADERVGVMAFAKASADHERQIVTFSGRGFDLPVICARAMHYGVSLDRYYGGKDGSPYGDPRNRYDAAHIDLCEQLAENGAAPRGRLDAYARLIGFPGKTDGGGAKVADLVAAGKLDDVRAYNAEDLCTTAALFLRWRFLTGRLDGEELLRASDQLEAFMRRGVAQDLASRVDWNLFGRPFAFDVAP